MVISCTLPTDCRSNSREITAASIIKDFLKSKSDTCAWNGVIQLIDDDDDHFDSGIRNVFQNARKSIKFGDHCKKKWRASNPP